MYLNDSNIKHLLAIFFGIGIAEELSILFDVRMPILALTYVVCLFIVIFNFSKLKEGKYIWEPGFGLIGIFAILYLIFLVIGYKAQFFGKLSAGVSLMVWIRSIAYLSEDKTEENNDLGDQEINEEDGNK
jgi:hypothetical protein